MPFDRNVNESEKTNKKDNKNFWPERLIYAVVITAMGCGLLFKSCDASKDVDVLKEQLKTAAVCCDEVADLQAQVESLKCDTTNLGRQLREKAAQLKKCKSNKTKKKNVVRKKVSESSSNQDCCGVQKKQKIKKTDVVTKDTVKRCCVDYYVATYTRHISVKR